MPTWGPGRNVRQRSANVRHSTRLSDGEMTGFGAGMAILLQKWCTFATVHWVLRYFTRVIERSMVLQTGGRHYFPPGPPKTDSQSRVIS
jgi:hypothetical protein